MYTEPLYQEWGNKLIPSSFGEIKGKKRYYRVYYGTVHWHSSDPDHIHRACVVFVQYGTNPDFEQARKRGEIKDKYPCHILDQDLDLVMGAMNELRGHFNYKS
ncbi:hypothetical protein [Peribacillus sp. AS_2]|uniref:hypothetical protein n=1 Tax=Peribacillus sp. AS_2 TaxID=2996755 RepID=UPI0022A671C6|nr:hypothetical protein [Peribacillus sp. AS_2]MCZ0871259.1 hypothetical protein [Peribacillus sp. AS_2]